MTKANDAVRVCKSGQMDQFMKVIGSRTVLTVKGDSFTLMGMYMMVLGWKTRRMVSENIPILMAPTSLVSGSKISNKGMERRSGQMGRDTLEPISMV